MTWIILGVDMNMTWNMIGYNTKLGKKLNSRDILSFECNTCYAIEFLYSIETWWLLDYLMTTVTILPSSMFRNQLQKILDLVLEYV